MGVDRVSACSFCGKIREEADFDSSHIMIIAVIGLFSIYFYTANHRQKKGKTLLEGTKGFRFTY